MFEQLSDFFTIEMIYLWLNIGIIPFWFVLIFFPQSKFCGYLIISVFPYLVFSAIYVYLVYYFFISDYNFLNNFNLYLSFDNLMDLFSERSFLIIFWSHFLVINLFCGSWIVKDSQQLMISKYLVFIPLVLTYFVGPLGILLYWIIRIFFAKNFRLF